MFNSGEEILADIDHTLDHLIKNALALRQLAEYEAFTADCATVHKVQHSLSGRILHMQELLTMLGHDNPESSKQGLYEKIQNKIQQYKELNNTMIDGIAKRFIAMQQERPIKKKPRIGHNRRRAPVRVPLKST